MIIIGRMRVIFSLVAASFLASVSGAGVEVTTSDAGAALARYDSQRASAGKIAFIRDGKPWPLNDIYVMRSNGAGVRRLTRTTQWRHDPAWSPDGRRIAFEVSDPDKEVGLWAMNADGTGAHRVTDGQAPSWSPDGRRLAFTRWDSTGSDPSIYTSAADGSHARKLIGEACTVIGCFDTSPAWSPDGLSIAFLRYLKLDGELQTDVFIIASTGKRLRRLTRTADEENRPAWSPDGRRIAFVVTGFGPDSARLTVVNANGTQRRQLTSGFHVNTPTWSPDGRKIALSSNGDIYVINADGSGLRRLVRGGFTPNWVGKT